MHAPEGTPRDIVTKIHSVVAKSLHTPEMNERLSNLGAQPVGNTPEEFAEFLRTEIAKWAKVVKASGARIDQAFGCGTIRGRNARRQPQPRRFCAGRSAWYLHGT